MSLLIVLLNLFLFFSYMVNNYVTSAVIVLLTIYELIICRKQLKFYKSDFVIISLIIVFLISFLFSPTKSSAIIYFLLFVASMLLVILLKNNKVWHVNFYKSAVFFSGIHVFATFLQYFFPNFVNNYINLRLLTPTQYLKNMYIYRAGGYAGITGQSGANAVYISIFIILIFCMIISQKIKKKNIIFVLLGLFALYLTDKSGPTLSIIIALLFTVYILIYNKSKDKFKMLIIRNILFMVTIVVAIYYFFMYKDFNSFGIYIAESSSGRLGIYSNMINIFKLHIWFGNGLLSVPYYLNIYGHNIYLQILCETGIFGFLVFFYFFVKIIKLGISNCKLNINNEKKFNSLVSFCFIIFFEFYGLTGNPIYDGFSLMFFALFLAIEFNCSIKNEI